MEIRLRAVSLGSFAESGIRKPGPHMNSDGQPITSIRSAEVPQVVARDLAPDADRGRALQDGRDEPPRRGLVFLDLGGRGCDPGDPARHEGALVDVLQPQLGADPDHRDGNREPLDQVGPGLEVVEHLQPERAGEGQHEVVALGVDPLGALLDRAAVEPAVRDRRDPDVVGDEAAVGGELVEQVPLVAADGVDRLQRRQVCVRPLAGAHPDPAAPSEFTHS
jgi:hypothetical protein